MDEPHNLTVLANLAKLIVQMDADPSQKAKSKTLTCQVAIHRVFAPMALHDAAQASAGLGCVNGKKLYQASS